MSIFLSLMGYSSSSWAQLLLLDLIRDLSTAAVRQLNQEIEAQQNQVWMAQREQRNKEEELHRRSLGMVAEEREAYWAMERQSHEELAQMRVEIRTSLQFKSLVLRLEALAQKQRQIQVWIQGDLRLSTSMRQGVRSRLAGLSARQAEAILHFRLVEGEYGGSWTDEQRIEAIYGLHQQLDVLYRDFMVLEMEIRTWGQSHREDDPSSRMRSWFQTYPRSMNPRNN